MKARRNGKRAKSTYSCPLPSAKAKKYAAAIRKEVKIKIMAKTQNSTVTETINGNLVVVREKVKDKNGKQLLTQDGRPYYNYIVRGLIRGEDRTIRLVPRDQGGFEPLDIMYSISDKAELVISEVTTEINGTKNTRTVYTAQVVDEDGELWKCELKPERDSAKTLLNFLLISLRKEQAAKEQGKPETAA